MALVSFGASDEGEALRIGVDKYEAFKSEVERLVAKGGMGDWKLEFAHKRLQGGHEAQFESNADCTVAYFTYTTSLAKGCTPRPVLAARHEFGHMLSARLTRLAHKRFVHEDEVLAEEEKLSMICERLLT